MQLWVRGGATTPSMGYGDNVAMGNGHPSIYCSRGVVIVNLYGVLCVYLYMIFGKPAVREVHFFYLSTWGTPIARNSNHHCAQNPHLPNVLFVHQTNKKPCMPAASALMCGLQKHTNHNQL